MSKIRDDQVKPFTPEYPLIGGGTVQFAYINRSPGMQTNGPARAAAKIKGGPYHQFHSKDHHILEDDEWFPIQVVASAKIKSNFKETGFGNVMPQWLLIAYYRYCYSRAVEEIVRLKNEMD